MSGLALALATPDDAQKLAQLAAFTFRDTWQHLYSKDVMDDYLADACSQASTLRQLQSPVHRHWVIRDGERLVAYAKAGPVNTPAPPPIPARSVELHRLYVLSDYKRRGLGKRLLNAFDAHAAAQYEAAYTCVWAENAPALALYYAAGFKKDGECFFPLGDFTNFDISPDFILRKNYI